MLTSRKQTSSYQNKIISDLESLPDITARRFTAFEDEVIRKHYGRLGALPIATALNKTRKQITDRANAMGVRRNEV